MDESKENYEIVHILTMRRRSLKRLKEKNS
jgi:hypothetical protein